MQYWNQENDEGMRRIGERYSALPDYALFGKYCLLREQGLRKPALSIIRQFAHEIGKRSVTQQREVALELVSLAMHTPEAHQLIAYPLHVVLQGILRQWTGDVPESPTPWKCLGYLRHDIECYEKARALDPADEFCTVQIAARHLRDVDFQGHHLSESVFLGEISEARESLRKAEALIRTLTTDSMRHGMEEHLHYYQTLLQAWEEYSTLDDTEEGFPEWSRNRGKEFDFWSIVYYG